MALISIKKHPSRRELRQFAAVWFPAFWLIVAWLVWRSTGNLLLAAAICFFSLLVSVVGFIVPSWMRYIFVGWMTIAYPVGWIIAHSLLALAYYAVLTPIGLALRAAGKDPLQKKLDRDCLTYWQPHRETEGTSPYFRQS
jgi:Saxitoxin biosynthesis operon protein SxtJ